MCSVVDVVEDDTDLHLPSCPPLTAQSNLQPQKMAFPRDGDQVVLDHVQTTKYCVMSPAVLYLT